MEAKLDYVSVGVNRVVNALAWGEHGGVAYAAHHMVALYDVESAKVVSTLCGHTGMVNCVLWVLREATPDLPSNQHLLFSGAADNTIRCWLVIYPSGHAQPSSPPATPVWSCLAVLSGHTAPVTSLAVHRLPPHTTSIPCSPLSPLNTAESKDNGDSSYNSAPPAPSALPGELLLVSTAGDDHVLVWGCGWGGNEQQQQLDGSEVAVEVAGASAAPHNAAAPPVAAVASEAAQGGCDAAADGDIAAAVAAAAVYSSVSWLLHQRLHVGTRLQDCAALSGLPLDPDWTLLATGGTDRRISLHLRPAGPGRVFSPVCVLEGHENWVRGVAFCTVMPEEGEAERGVLPQLLLASVSQDRYGRIWKLQPELLGTPTAAAAGNGPPVSAPGGVGGELAALIQRYAPKPQFTTTRTRSPV